MTMHLEGPWMTTTKYSKRPHKKWASSAAKQQAQELEQQWQELQQQWTRAAPKFSNTPVTKNKPQAQPQQKSIYPPGREPQQTIPSRDSGVQGAVKCSQPQRYTGDKILGIGTMHKSNAVPVFSDSEARDISSMRR
jgi:hypothetical protein